MVKAILSLSSRFYQLAFIVHDGTGNVKFNLPKEAQSRGEKRKGLGRFAYRGFERRSEEGFRHELKDPLIHSDRVPESEWVPESESEWVPESE